MKPDDFERRLSRQPPKEIPAAWRAEILAVACDARVARQPSAVVRRFWLATFNEQLSTIFWPHPKAWAGLAAVWVLILVLNLSLRDGTPAQLAEKASPPSPEMIAELRKQQRLFAELMGPRDGTVADRSKTFVPRPRSEGVEWRVG
jgi:hypothetical protein